MGYPWISTVKSVGTSKVTFGVDKTGAYKLPYYIQSFEVENTHDIQDIYVSFDGGSSYRTVKAGETWSGDFREPYCVGEITLWASGASTTFELVLEIAGDP